MKSSTLLVLFCALVVMAVDGGLISAIKNVFHSLKHKKDKHVPTTSITQTVTHLSDSILTSTVIGATRTDGILTASTSTDAAWSGITPTPTVRTDAVPTTTIMTVQTPTILVYSTETVSARTPTTELGNTNTGTTTKETTRPGNSIPIDATWSGITVTPTTPTDALPSVTIATVTVSTPTVLADSTETPITVVGSTTGALAKDTTILDTAVTGAVGTLTVDATRVIDAIATATTVRDSVVTDIRPTANTQASSTETGTTAIGVVAPVPAPAFATAIVANTTAAFPMGAGNTPATTPIFNVPTVTTEAPTSPTATSLTPVTPTIVSEANGKFIPAISIVSNTAAVQPILTSITASSSAPVAGSPDGAGAGNCTCSASPVFDPVCDSAGNTHQNEEALKCAVQCLNVAPDVKLLRSGPCDSLLIARQGGAP